MHLHTSILPQQTHQRDSSKGNHLD